MRVWRREPGGGAGLVSPGTPASIEWSEGRRRFPRRVGWAVLALLCLLAAFGVLGTAAIAPPGPPKASDIALYSAIVADMRAGQSYDAAAVAEHRRFGYPLRPFPTVRPPTLALLMAALPGEAAARWLLAGIGLVTLAVAGWRARQRIGVMLPVLLPLASGIGLTFIAAFTPMHEVWAGALIALSLALHGPRSWWLSLLVGLLAVSIRDLAAPYLLVMGVLAWRDGQRGQAMAWAAAIGLVALGLWRHGVAVNALVVPGDKVSPGWLAFGGWDFVLDVLRFHPLTMLLPRWVIALLAPFALFGLLCRRGPISDRVALTVLGFCAAFLLIGRPNNSYWGLMLAPLWPLGLAGTWGFLRDLLSARQDGSPA